jgi:hypothetical protein
MVIFCLELAQNASSCQQSVLCVLQAIGSVIRGVCYPTSVETPACLPQAGVSFCLPPEHGACNCEQYVV